MRVSVLMISCLVAIVLTDVADAATTIPTGRRVYTTVIRSRLESGYNVTTCAMSAVNRLTVSVKNISTVPQTVTITFADLQADVEAQSNTAAIAATQFPSWTSNALWPEWRGKGTIFPDTSVTLTVAPGQSDSRIYHFLCDYQTNQKCTFGTVEWAVTDKPNVLGAAFTSNSSAKIEVAEDRGAVLADLHIQTLLNVCGMQKERSERLPFNGGRPF